MSLEVRGGGWRFGDEVVLDGIDLTVPAGTVTGLLGPNGSGKSTLLRLIAGVGAALPGRVTATGDVRWNGSDLLAMRPRDRARRVALVEQDARTEVELSVRDAVLLGRIPHRSRWAADSDADRTVAQRALDAVGLDSLADRPLASLSGGERQRVHLARALAQEPELLLLDEPTNHLDIQAQLAALRLVRRATAGGTTAVVALHDLNLAAAYCDHAVVLAHGTVVAAGPVADVLVPAVIDPVYGVSTTLLAHPGTDRPVLAFRAASPPDPAAVAWSDDADDDRAGARLVRPR
jgi:iron complex transport system ATP-binding protein